MLGRWHCSSQASQLRNTVVVFSPTTACITPSGTMNMGRKLPPRLPLGFFISCHRVMCSLQKWGLIINFWWRLKSNGISLYLVLEVPQGLQQCIRKYSIPTWDFCLITMVFLRKPLSSNVEHFLLNYLVSSCLLIVLQGSMLPCGYFLDPSLC